MKIKATVLKVCGDRVWLNAIPAGCGRCHEPGGCGMLAHKPANQPYSVANTLSAKMGDTVVLEIEKKDYFWAVSMAFVLPISLLLAGALLGRWLGFSEPLFGSIGLVIGIGTMAIYDKLIRRYKPFIEPIMVSIEHV